MAESAVNAVRRLSVVVPCHNYGRYLSECVHSALAQEGVAVDVQIWDDASTDDSWQVAQSLASADERVTCHRNPVNRGMIGTINEAVAGVTTDYLVKLDADDMLTPGALSRAVDLLQAHPTVSFAYGRPLYFTGQPPTPRSSVRGWNISPGHAWLALRCRRAVNVIGQPEVVIRRSSLQQAGPYDPALPHTSDFDMWLRLAMVGDVGWIRGADQGWMRVHAESMQQTVHRGHVVNLTGRRDCFDAFFAGAGSTLPQARELHRAAMKGLAVEALGLACSAYRRGAAESEPVDDYVAFAAAVYPPCRTLWTWRELQLRQRSSGTLADRLHPSLTLGPAGRRASKALRELRWKVTGT